jgi:hypothetical protein
MARGMDSVLSTTDHVVCMRASGLTITAMEEVSNATVTAIGMRVTSRIISLMGREFTRG